MTNRIEPRTMRAAILTEQKRPLTMATVELPEELLYGQVLVRVDCTGVCGSQLGEIEGAKGPDKYLPHLLGHEGAGRVLQVGEGVRRVKPGDSVVMHWMKAAGIDAPTPQYRWDGRPLNGGWVTTFNEYAVVSENRVTPVPSDFDLECAALFGCAATTGLGVVRNNARLRLGESIVVLGTGGVGLNVVQGAALASGHPVVAVDRTDEKLELARRMGATHAIRSDDSDWTRTARSILGPQGADVVVDTTGAIEMIEAAYELTHAQGRAVFVGVPFQGRKASLHTLPLHFGKQLSGSHGGDTRPEEDIPRYARLVQAGKMNLAPLITDRFPFEDVNEALAALREGRVVGRCLVDVSGALAAKSAA
ncbi:MAG: zinc-binding dehydrogenase [Planctomycetales bacterium]